VLQDEFVRRKIDIDGIRFEHIDASFEMGSGHLPQEELRSCRLRGREAISLGELCIAEVNGCATCEEKRVDLMALSLLHAHEGIFALDLHAVQLLKK